MRLCGELLPGYAYQHAVSGYRRSASMADAKQVVTRPVTDDQDHNSHGQMRAQLCEIYMNILKTYPTGIRHVFVPVCSVLVFFRSYSPPILSTDISVPATCTLYSGVWIYRSATLYEYLHDCQA